MNPSLDSQQIVASLTGIAPFLWPFILLSLGVALTTISPLLWNYSTWLLFIVPLVITVFRAHSHILWTNTIRIFGICFKNCRVSCVPPWSPRDHLQVSPNTCFTCILHSPDATHIIFCLFPALPVIWHYISYHYRRRLKAVTTSVSRTTAGLNLVIARAQQAVALAHTHEKQVLYTVSATRSAASLTFPRLSTDFIDSSVSAGEGQQLVRRKAELVRTLGAGLAEKVIASETKMTSLEDQAAKLRILLEQAVAVAVEGDMGAGEALAADAASSLEGIVKQVEELCSAAEETRRTWVEYRRRLNALTTSVSGTTAGLDRFIARAQQAVALAHTHEKQALYTVSATRNAASLTFPRLSTDFIDSSVSAVEGQQSVRRKAELVRTLGAGLAEKVIASETKMASLEGQAAKLRILLEQAVAVAVEGDMGAGEALAADAATSLEGIIKQVDELCSAAEEARRTWVEYRRRLHALTTFVSRTTTGLDFITARAHQAVTLAHTHEEQALYTVSATRSAASLTFPRLSTDFISSVSAGEGEQLVRRKAELVRTLGAGLAEKVIASEIKMTSLEDQAAKLRILLEQAVAVAVEGDMGAGEALAADAATSGKTSRAGER
ncbi:hypothetical protein F5148DRAFT_1282713 [Russula earlei]|uniref:Uncharacterized protein n=1 Tax=Russula earlei TaxID=71964 RepID=A0ACC0UF64_9AGAM|nr:hypothetical protein F5148DRAFT_1282713 [Russula earlei]